MIVYHASNMQIEKFIFGKNGVHFGGLSSAMEAALRKVNDLNDDVYIHTCELSYSKNDIYESFDVGNEEEWLLEIEEAKKQGKKLLRYKNEYEPSNQDSYLVIDSSLITLSKVKKIPAFEVEKLLCEDDNFF